jgi:hypothetical protein
MRVVPMGLALAAAVLPCACVTLTPEGARVAVYRAPLDGSSGDHFMSKGCRLIAVHAPVSMTELEMEGQKDPYRVARNEAGAAGANALLVRSRVVMSRRAAECPAASPITDCPPNQGAWLTVVMESYTCSPDAFH